MDCQNCSQHNRTNASFCSNCGQRLNIEKESDYNKHVKRVFLFSSILVTYIVILGVTKFNNDYKSLILSDCIFAVIIIFFSFQSDNSIFSLIKFKKFNWKLFLKVLIISPIVAIIVHYFAVFFNYSVLNKSHTIYFEHFKDSPYPLLFCIISIAVFPAIFEEIAFRGILFDELLNITKLKPTIIITSILFTSIHFSVISSLWLFPGALIFGLMRAKYRSITYGIIGHFMYNSSIVLIEILLGN